MRSIIEGVGEIDGIKAYRGEKILKLASKLSGYKLPEEIGVELAVDVFYSFYLPIPVIDHEEASKARDEREVFRINVVSGLLSNANLWRVKPYTVADSMTSTVAAASLLDKLARLLNKAPSRAASGGRRRQQGHKRSASPGDTDMESRIAEAIEKAMETVERDVKTSKAVKQLMARLGVGKTSTLSFDDSMEEILRLARETDVSRILERIEGMKLSISKSKGAERHTKGWIDSIEYGDDIERVHHSQLAMPEELFYAALANGRLLLFRKVLPAMRGPIYVLLDKSGSMVGAKIDWARAVAVALFKKAVEENRPFYARFFDSIAYPPLSLKPRGKPSDVIKLLSYLARVRAGGGTDITRATATAAEDIIAINKGKDKVCDLVLITDGEDRLSPEILERIIRRASVRLHTVMVQGHNPYLQKVSYRYLVVRKLEEKEALKVVEFS